MKRRIFTSSACAVLSEHFSSRENQMEDGYIPPERITQRLVPECTDGREYLLDLCIDPATHVVLSYRLRAAPNHALIDMIST